MASLAPYPRQYAAFRGTPTEIDANPNKEIWERVPWSEPFVEIRGSDAPAGSEPSEAQATRMKMLWDDDNLYILAVIDLAAGDELVAKFTERNSPIFHTDSDFEVFVDPAGCCHGYKELELNAINTVWNLMLNRPYSDGGGERSGRVARPGEANYWETLGQRTAARVLLGQLQDASQPSRWCCEVAMPHADQFPGAPVQGPTPAVGSSWRINFSRVEKGGNVNWVWSPQIIWTPEKACYEGKVNMHLPDAWGYVVFADADGCLSDGQSATCWRDPAWPARRAAAAAYYTGRTIWARHRRAPTADELREEGLMDASALEGFDVSVSNADSYLFCQSNGSYVVELIGHGHKARINHQRLLTVEPLAA